MTNPLVSVFIRVRDEGPALGQVLQALSAQEVDGPVEVVVMDNESADDSREVALRSGARCVVLPRQHFGYGRALNLGVGLCRSEIVILLSAHSIPQSRTWIVDLIAPLRDGTADAAFCRQVPLADMSRLERKRFAVFPGASATIGREEFVRGCAARSDPYVLAKFSNSACAIRRRAALGQPFRDLPYAEDRAFTVDVLMAGGTVAYLHGPSVSYERRVTWRSAYRTACRAQVSKRLIRELAATYTDCRFSSLPDAASRIARALLVVPAAAVRVLTAAADRPGSRVRGARFALCSTGATLGLARGTIGWRRHVAALSVDEAALRAAQRACTEAARPGPVPSELP